jgi:hypothetical protein
MVKVQFLAQQHLLAVGLVELMMVLHGLVVQAVVPVAAVAVMEVLVELELLDKVATVAQETVHQRNLEVAVAALEMLGVRHLQR